MFLDKNFRGAKYDLQSLTRPTYDKKEQEVIAHMILYVRDQALSTEFFAYVLDQQPFLNVPGMTEFKLSEKCVLGLMPETGIKRLLGESLPDPSEGNGIPRAELYLVVGDAQAFYLRALEKGALPLSELADRDWGQKVAYCLEPNGHVLAFAT